MKDLIAMINFEDKEFYITPPREGATQTEWTKWLKADEAKRKAAKAAYTKMISEIVGDQDISFAPDEQPAVAVRAGEGGVYRQGVLTGFTGDPEEGDVQIEAAVDAAQELGVSLSDMESRRSKHRSRGYIKRKQKDRRKARRKKIEQISNNSESSSTRETLRKARKAKRKLAKQSASSQRRNREAI